MLNIVLYNNYKMKHSFAIIGGGPAGIYMAKLLSKHYLQPFVHVYEQ
jgi:uncharacterized NAD(P)/FAD-binding protein YdhS